MKSLHAECNPVNRTTWWLRRCYVSSPGTGLRKYGWIAESWKYTEVGSIRAHPTQEKGQGRKSELKTLDDSKQTITYELWSVDTESMNLKWGLVDSAECQCSEPEIVR